MRVGARVTTADRIQVRARTLMARGKRILSTVVSQRRSAGGELPVRDRKVTGMAVARLAVSMPDIGNYLDDCKFILMSNREPFEHLRGVHGFEVRQPAGGLVSALDPTMR